MYGAPLETIFVKTLVGNAEVSTSALRTTGAVLRVAGNLVGAAWLGITYFKYKTGQISGAEPALDATFGAIGYLGPWGATINVGYFNKKYLHEHYSGNALFYKPIQWWEHIIIYYSDDTVFILIELKKRTFLWYIHLLLVLFLYNNKRLFSNLWYSLLLLRISIGTIYSFRRFEFC